MYILVNDTRNTTKCTIDHPRYTTILYFIVYNNKRVYVSNRVPSPHFKKIITLAFLSLLFFSLLFVAWNLTLRTQEFHTNYFFRVANASEVSS